MQENPDIVINTIALSSYYICEMNSKLCRKLNFKVTKNIVKVCKKINAKMVFISSSYVFNGNKGGYLETDMPNSTSQYALSKIDAERVVLKLKDSIILRLEPVYGVDLYSGNVTFGTNTFKTEVSVAFPNLLRMPIFINDITPILLLLIEKNQNGVFNIAGEDMLTWLNFLNYLASLENAENRIGIVDNANWILEPPHNTSLNVEKILSLGAKITKFDQALKEMKSNKIGELF